MVYCLLVYLFCSSDFALIMFNSAFSSFRSTFLICFYFKIVLAELHDKIITTCISTEATTIAVAGTYFSQRGCF